MPTPLRPSQFASKLGVRTSFYSVAVVSALGVGTTVKKLCSSAVITRSQPSPHLRTRELFSRVEYLSAADVERERAQVGEESTAGAEFRYEIGRGRHPARARLASLPEIARGLVGARKLRKVERAAPAQGRGGRALRLRLRG
jgi:hypothetical protein